MLELLIIEDDTDYSLLLSRKLSRVYSLTPAVTLAAGIALARVEPFHCLLLDLKLPDSPPIHTVHRARAALPELPIVVVTGDPDPLWIAKAIHAGADGYWIKGRDDQDVGRMVLSIGKAVTQRSILNRLDDVRGQTEVVERALESRL